MIGREGCIKFLKKVIEASEADQTEALLLTEDSSLTRFSNSAVHQHVAERNQTLVLRVISGKRIAVFNTNLLDRLSVKNAIQTALGMARVQRPNEAFVSLPEPRPIPEVNTFSRNVGRLTPTRKVRSVKRILSFASGKRYRASGSFSNGSVEVAVANSLGVQAYQDYSDFFIHLIVDDGGGSGYASVVGRDPDSLDVDALAAEAVGKASKADPVQIDPGEYDVILEPYAVNEFLSFLAFLGFNALSVQEKRSFFCGAFGTKMVDEKITIYDDGLDPAGLQVPFDFEGVPKERVTFFEKGVVKDVTYDSFTAGREGKRSTGHALVAPNTAGPIPINLFMEAGTSSLGEMVRSTRRGIYVTRFHYTNVVEPMKAVITGMTRDGTYLIDSGEIKNPIRNLRFTESILKALSRVTAVSRERKLCSEGTVYSRRFVTGSVVPAIKVEGFNFSGVSTL